MSTTRTTSDGSRAPIPYTVVGGPRWDRVRRYPFPLTLLVLGRGDRLFKGELLKDLQARGIGEMLWVEGDGVLDGRGIPRARLPRCALSPRQGSQHRGRAGEHRNRGVARPAGHGAVERYAAFRVSPPSSLGPFEKSGVLCTVPVARNAPRGAHSLVAVASMEEEAAFRLLPRAAQGRGARPLSLRLLRAFTTGQKFAQSGGLRPRHRQPLLAEAGLRLSLFALGENAAGHHGISLTYTGAPPEEDTTPDAGIQAVLAQEYRRADPAGDGGPSRAEDARLHAPFGHRALSTR